MKKLFRRNQVIITALALLIAVAGYVSYTQTNTPDEAQTASAQNVSDTYDISAEDTNLQKAVEENKVAEKVSTSAETGKESVPGETVLTQAPVSSVDYAAQVKLSREQMRSKNKESLMDVINNERISDAQKQEAVSAMISITDIAERENAAELLLSAKGFTDVVVSITDDSADVVLNMGDVTDARRAQVEDIVKRKTGISPEHIIITPISDAQP